MIRQSFIINRREYTIDPEGLDNFIDLCTANGLGVNVSFDSQSEMPRRIILQGELSPEFMIKIFNGLISQYKIQNKNSLVAKSPSYTLGRIAALTTGAPQHYSNICWKAI